MKIRLATAADYEIIMSLMAQLNPDDQPMDEPLGKTLFTGILNTSGLYIYLAEVDDKPVATCYLNIIPNLTRGGRPYALLENIVTDDKHRRKGVGKMLLTRVIATAFDLNCYKVMLMTGRDSDVHTFYEGCRLEKNSKTAFILRAASN